MKRIVLAFAVVIAVLIAHGAFSQTVPTSLGVPNSPPFLLQNIPDAFVIYNTTTEFIDLDDYFDDPNGDSLTFTFSQTINISFSIDGNNLVSIIPDETFIGSESVNVTVSDGSFNVTSNQFTITVGQDTEPPLWSNPTRNRQNIYQNYIVNFTSLWSDNLGLSHYYFSINQGSGWADSSVVNFTGTSNFSVGQAQISAGEGVFVQWRFTAFDRFGNSNTTRAQNFTVQEISSTSSGSAAGGITGRASGVAQSSGSSSEAALFEAEPKNIRVSLRQGDTLTRVVKIRNLANRDLAFSPLIEGIADSLVLSASEFTVPAGESYDLLLDFVISNEMVPDQYFGSLVLRSSQSLTIPIVLEVREFDAELQLIVNISDEYQFVRSGEEVQASIRIENLRDVREAPAELFYAIKDFNGNIIEAASENFTLYASFDEVRSLVVPPGSFEGEHIFYARIVSGELVDLNSDTFFIGSRFQILYWLDKLFYPILILLLLLIIFLLIWVRERSRKKKKLLELYLLLNQLRSLVEEGKLDTALDIYKRVKVVYGQHVSADFIKDKEKLREELEKFSKLLEKSKEAKPNESSEEGSKEESEKAGETESKGGDSKEGGNLGNEDSDEAKSDEGSTGEKNDASKTEEKGKESKSEEKQDESKNDGTEEKKEDKPHEEKKEEKKSDEMSAQEENDKPTKGEPKSEPKEKKPAETRTGESNSDEKPTGIKEGKTTSDKNEGDKVDGEKK